MSLATATSLRDCLSPQAYQSFQRWKTVRAELRSRDWLPQQQRLIDSAAPEVLLSGAFGAGKTRALCQKVYDLARLYRLNCVGLFRATLSALRATTLRTLLEGDGTLPPVIPPADVRNHNKTERVITLRNGSEIVYGGLKSSTNQEEWFNSLNLGAAAVDQAEELAHDDWQLLQGRLRLNVPPVRQMVAVCNPRHPGHWIYQRFFVERPAGAELIQANTFDNPHLPPDYLARLETFTGPFYERFVLGRWIGLEGLVYPNFDPTVHVIDRFHLDPSWRRWRAIDFGYQNPFVCLWVCEAGADAPVPEGSLVVYREIYYSRRRVAEHGAMILRLSGPERFVATYADHDAAERAELHAQGIGTVPASKAVAHGIQTMRGALGNENGALPRVYFFRDALVERDPALTIDPVTGQKRHAPTCTADEFGFYRYAASGDDREAKEEPLKVHDHGMDALRYLLHSMGAGGEPTFVETAHTSRWRMSGEAGRARGGGRWQRDA